MQDVDFAVKLARRATGAIALCMALASVTSVHAEEPERPYTLAGGAIEYTPGRGASIRGTGLTLGGYAAIEGTRDDGGPARLALEDLALFVSWDPLPRLHLFSELEVENGLVLDDHGHGGTSDADFVVERLHGDFTVSDALHLRLGKFLTPVGRWNQIHAQPLVWTTSRPLATELPFDPHVTGGMVFGEVYPRVGTLGYSLYGQFVDQLDGGSRPQITDRGGGGRIEYSLAGASVGGSYLASERDGRWRHLTGLDGLWHRGRFEVMTELVHLEPVTGSGRHWGFYVQGVSELWSRLYLIARYERVDREHGVDFHIGVAGLAWKPTTSVVLKAEYLFSDNRASLSPPGVKSSVAILF